VLLMELFAPQGALTDDRRADVSRRLVTAVMSAPGPGIEEAVERARAMTHAIVHEPAAWSVGTAPAGTGELPCWYVRVSVPAGHLTDAMRAQLVARVTAVLAEEDPDPERFAREPAAWVQIVEVADGGLGAFGQVLRLGDLMRLVLDGGTPEPAPAVAQLVDPICGMDVALTPDALTLVRDGTTYAFCSSHCRDAFAGRAP
jgi:YHS domain-containing protein/phenylpyruvate tautomerase PptA (4-oxalocrotonate tautomerase family)